MLELVKKKHKLALIVIAMILILCLSFGLSSTWALDTSLVTIDLNGEDVITINVGDDYVERGATVLVGGKDMTKDLIIDTSQVDVNTPGTYYVTYNLDAKDQLAGQTLIGIMTSGIGSTLGNVLGGILQDTFGLDYMFMFIYIVTITGALIIFTTKKINNKKNLAAS